MRYLAIALTMCFSTVALAQDAARPVVSMIVDTADGIPLSYTGIVVAKTEVNLGFPMIGTVAARSVDVGEVVARGDELAQLNNEDLSSDLRSAEAGIIVAKAQLRSASSARDRIKQLAERGVASPSQLEDAERALVSAQARLEQAEASRASAKDMLDLATLTAPFDGVVTDTLAEAGTTLSAGQTVLRLADVGEREVVIDVSDEDAGLLAKGDRFSVRLLANESVAADAVLTRIDPVAERSTRTQRLHLALEDPSAAFRLGALARVEPARGTDGRIAVPASALLDPPAVWVVDRTGNTVDRRSVIVGESNDALAIIASGLKAGDEVIIKGVNSLEQGQVVGPRVSQ
ncbi:MAG: efflux RND transporter periplasmic adaptor subunit [Hoeflea sp.]|uniref:efflux RND transporter periplasmic adaptor subunit n=1 Tax=Hoeflea sp. TaxID=1940281 RepID=UPI0032ECBD3D